MIKYFAWFLCVVFITICFGQVYDFFQKESVSEFDRLNLSLNLFFLAALFYSLPLIPK